jgi:hypothetical protein
MQNARVMFIAEAQRFGSHNQAKEDELQRTNAKNAGNGNGPEDGPRDSDCRIRGLLGNMHTRLKRA